MTAKTPDDLPEHLLDGTNGTLEHVLVTLPGQQVAVAARAVAEGFEALRVPDGVILRHDVPREHRAIAAAVERVRALAEDMGVRYDGWGLPLTESENAESMAPFTDRFRPGATFAFGLGDGRYGHGLFLAGHPADGYLFDITALVTDRPARSADIAAAPRCWRQPLIATIDPDAVIAVRDPAGPADHSWGPVAFRVPCGWPEPEALSDLAAELGLDRALPESNWLAFVQALAVAGRRLPSDGWQIVTAHPSRRGRIRWEDGPVVTQLPLPDGHLPMPFNPAWRLPDLVSALQGAADPVTLYDAVV